MYIYISNFVFLVLVGHHGFWPSLPCIMWTITWTLWVPFASLLEAGLS